MASDPKQDKLRHKIHRAHHQQLLHPGKARRYKKKVAFLQHLIAKNVARRHGLDHETVLDGCPMPVAHKLVLLDARRNGWTGVVESADRRTAIARLLKRLGKSDQAELYQLFLEGRGLPANPPTMGTHIRIGDGTVGSVGEKLAYWREGIDSTEAGQLRDVLNRLGYKAYQPYKTASEYHHTNLEADPEPVLIKRGLV